MESNKKLQMYGGTFGGLVPMIVLVIFLIWLSVTERGGTAAFWAGGWLAIVAGLLFAKDKSHYCQTILKGLGDKNGIIIVTAWMFAGVFGKLMVAGGLVEGLLWFGLETGAQGAYFTVLAFIAAVLFSVGTGTSTGTVIALLPVLYPAGVYLGADPVMLAVGILAGGALGDNLAPISDTTIVSAYTQGAEMGNVVRSRLPLSLSAGVIAIVVLAITGGGGSTESLPALDTETNPIGLLMLVSLVIVFLAAFYKRHILEALIYGNISAVVLGLITGNMSLSAIFAIPDERGLSTGLIEDGISGVTGAIIFALLVLAVTQVLVESGIMTSLLNWAQKTVAKSVRQAESSIIGITILASIPIAANAPALLLVGPSFVKSLGEKFNLTAERRANLMDCAVCTIFYMLPWHIAVIVWYGTLATAAETWSLTLPAISTAALNPYSWALLLVLIFSVITGWNRKLSSPVSTTVNGDVKGV